VAEVLEDMLMLLSLCPMLHTLMQSEQVVQVEQRVTEEMLEAREDRV
jgi:hypothetical protein